MEDSRSAMIENEHEIYYDERKEDLKPAMAWRLEIYHDEEGIWNLPWPKEDLNSAMVEWLEIRYGEETKNPPW